MRLLFLFTLVSQAARCRSGSGKHYAFLNIDHIRRDSFILHADGESVEERFAVLVQVVERVFPLPVGFGSYGIAMETKYGDFKN